MKLPPTFRFPPGVRHSARLSDPCKNCLQLTGKLTPTYCNALCFYDCVNVLALATKRCNGCNCIAGSKACSRCCTRCRAGVLQVAPTAGPDISLLDPVLQKQWDQAATKHLGPIVITPHTNLKVWWQCGQCPDGHLHGWAATVNNRSIGRSCPQCSGRKCASTALWPQGFPSLLLSGTHSTMPLAQKM